MFNNLNPGSKIGKASVLWMPCVREGSTGTVTAWSLHARSLGSMKVAVLFGLRQPCGGGDMVRSGDDWH